MRKFLLSLTLVLVALSSVQAQKKSGKDGFKIKVKFTDVTDSSIFLVHYYGKPLPTIYRTDSAKLDKNGEAVFESDTFTLGGIYMVLMSDKSTYFEMLLNNGDEFTVTATKSKLPVGLKFKGSPENERFASYVSYLMEYSERSQALNKKYSASKTAKDSSSVRDEFKALSDELKKYRNDYIAKYPKTLLSQIFGALKVPEVPKETHYNEDGSVDSTFGYTYYKEHYWDDFDFQDDRLIHTPIYDGRLDEYFNKLTLPIVDTIQAEADMLLAKAEGSRDVYKYTLWWITRFVEKSKIMGMDAAFVYLVEKYYMRGKAFWLKPDDLEKYIKRAKDIAPNVIGNIAPELKMPDANGQVHSLHGMSAKYTLLIFWSPECGHCLKEMPQVDSLYDAVLKDKGVKVYAVRTEGEVDKWKEMIKEHGLEDWTHVYDPERKSRFRSDYDIYSTPVLYLLDQNKIIQGKRMDHTNILEVIEMVERRKKDQNKS